MSGSQLKTTFSSLLFAASVIFFKQSRMFSTAQNLRSSSPLNAEQNPLDRLVEVNTISKNAGFQRGLQVFSEFVHYCVPQPIPSTIQFVATFLKQSRGSLGDNRCMQDHLEEALVSGMGFKEAHKAGSHT